MLKWLLVKLKSLLNTAIFYSPYTWWRPSAVFISFNPNSIGKLVQKTNHNDYHLVVLFSRLQMLWRTQNGRLCAADEAPCQKQNKRNRTKQQTSEVTILREGIILCAFYPLSFQPPRLLTRYILEKPWYVPNRYRHPSAFVTQGNQLWSFYSNFCFVFGQTWKPTTWHHWINVGMFVNRFDKKKVPVSICQSSYG